VVALEIQQEAEVQWLELAQAPITAIWEVLVLVVLVRLLVAAAAALEIVAMFCTLVITI
jgi:hypothetical protein